MTEAKPRYLVGHVYYERCTYCKSKSFCMVACDDEGRLICNNCSNRLNKLESYPPVRTKADFVRRYALGEFGNASPTWNDVHSFRRDALHEPYGLFHLRNRTAGGPTYYNLHPLQIAVRWTTVPDPENWYCSAMAPEERKVFQGEVAQTFPGSGRCGLDLTYNTLPLPMREGMTKGMKATSGILASTLLRHYLCPNSYEWLGELLTRYPYHVIEFSTYSVNWGTLPRFNTVFWEIRNY